MINLSYLTELIFQVFFQRSVFQYQKGVLVEFYIHKIRRLRNVKLRPVILL